MKKRILAALDAVKLKIALVITGALLSNKAQAQIFGNGGSAIQTEIEGWWPYAVLVTFIISQAFNLGNFFGENRDIKAGIKNLIIYVVAIGAITGAYTWLKSSAKL